MPARTECKWSADQFEPDGLKAFRARYRVGPSFVVTADTAPGQSYTKRLGTGLAVTFTSLRELVSACA